MKISSRAISSRSLDVGLYIFDAETDVKKIAKSKLIQLGEPAVGVLAYQIEASTSKLAWQKLKAAFEDKVSKSKKNL